MNAQKKPSDLDRVLDGIDRLGNRLEPRLVQIASSLEACCHGGGRSLGGFVAAVYGRRTIMAVNIPVPELKDTEKIMCSVMPRLSNGHVSPNASITWTPAGDVQAEVGTDPFVFHDKRLNPDGSVLWEEDVTCPGAYNAFALTPGPTGTGTLTASGSDSEGTFEAAEFGPIHWMPGVPRSLNASVGSPVSDL